MKINYKKNVFLPTLLAVLVLTGCVKENARTFTDFSSTGETVILQGSGLANFKATNLRVDNTSATPDSIQFFAALSSANTSPSDVAVTIAVDNTLITTYNAANSTKFQPFPAGSYKVLNTTLKIPAGSHYAGSYVVLDQTKFDPTISYMLPISIKDAGGKPTTSNLNTLYYNIIGNPIAGNYTREWIRYNNVGGTGSPAFDQTSSVVFSAVDPTSVSIASGTGVNYILTFKNTNGVLSNFQVSFDDASVTAANISITSGPTIITADPVAKKYAFNFTYNNSAGAARNITDIFTK